MTGHFSKNIMADSLTGMIFAAEGIKGAVVLLNGPMGCKFYHSTTSQFLSVRPLMYLPAESGEKVPVDYNYLNDWFFRQERVPCTYLDGYDYVYGTAGKVEEGLAYLRDNLDFELLVLVNSPGASLIGDQLAETAARVLADKPCVVLESPGFSGDFDEGYENAALEILEAFAEEIPAPDGGGNADRKSVNILGLSIWDRYHDGDRGELVRMLSLCGIDVNCVLCGSCSLEEIRRVPSADLNLVVNPRAGARCARWLQERFGMKSVILNELPIGFEASVKLTGRVCSALGADDSAVLRESEEKRAFTWYKVNDIYNMCGKPDGTLFAVEGSAAAVTGYCRFFMEYLGMISDCVSVTGNVSEAQAEELRGLLSRFGAGDAAAKDIMDTAAELVFADANTIASLMTTGRTFCGIEISLPGMGYTDLVPKTHLGINGALFLTEQVLNGLMSKL